MFPSIKETGRFRSNLRTRSRALRCLSGQELPVKMLRPALACPICFDQQLLRFVMRRVILFLGAITVLFLGLASRHFQDSLPTFLADYAGDTLWALMLFLLVSTGLACQSTLARAAISLTLAFLVEISQLYHASWIDSIRQTTLGGLVLGYGFLWTDLVCYSVGVAMGAFTEWAVGQVARRA